MALADARTKARKIRSQIEAGLDPIVERRKEAGIPTFREAAALVHAEHKAGWKNGKHNAQWLSSLENHVFPGLGEVAVSQIEAPAVRDVLAAIWLTKPETAKRIRQRIKTIVDWAVAKGYRETTLPMPVIDKALPKQRVVVKHHEALAYADLPEFLKKLREKETVGRLALEALILTCVRSGDVRGMKWAEIDLEALVWRVPVEDGRGKGMRIHNVPVTPSMLALLERAKPYRRANSDLVFAGFGRGKTPLEAVPLSDNTLRKVAIDMGYAITAHGFRSTFADWVAESTTFPRELKEAALAHTNKDKVEAAYTRTDYLEKRRILMAAWADYCEGTDGGNVVRLAG